jgi:hypothetical protein
MDAPGRKIHVILMVENPEAIKMGRNMRKMFTHFRINSKTGPTPPSLPSDGKLRTKSLQAIGWQNITDYSFQNSRPGAPAWLHPGAVDAALAGMVNAQIKTM